jgi:hypothetical protein
MPKAAVKTTKGKAASGKPTFTCACTRRCKGRVRELSEALYNKHAKFRELDEATNKGNTVDDLASRQANVQHSQHDESVSFRIVIQVTSLKYTSFSLLFLCLSSLRHRLRPLLNCPSHPNCLPRRHPLMITPTHLCRPALMASPLQIYQVQLHNRTVSLLITPLRSLMTTWTPLIILILGALSWIPATKISMLVLSWTRRILHCRYCQILKAFSKTLASKTYSRLLNSSGHFSLRLMMILIAKWIRMLSNGCETHLPHLLTLAHFLIYALAWIFSLLT